MHRPLIAPTNSPSDDLATVDRSAETSTVTSQGSSTLRTLLPHSLPNRKAVAATPAARQGVAADTVRRPLQLLSFASMLAELEHCRKLADHDETPFGLLRLSAQSSQSLDHVLATLENLTDTAGYRFGRAGYLGRRKVGLIVEGGSIFQLGELSDMLRVELGDSAIKLEQLVYPYVSEDSVRSNDKGDVELASMQPLFSLQMPLDKRIVDILGSLLGLIACIPLFLVVAIVIKLRSPGPVFYRQLRSGRGGRPFKMVKFRTMVVGAHAQQEQLRHLDKQDGPAFKIPDDPRVTKIGQKLRTTCIDELPQLWNVLKGEMSLVGPRPLPCKETDASAWWQRRRLDLTPGITCFWQSRGRSLVSFDEWMRMDLEYVRRRSMRCDMEIICSTIKFLVRRRKAPV